MTAPGATAKTIEVTEQNFNEITPKGIVLLDWWATWCGPCRSFAPTFEAAAGRHPDVVFGKIDTDAQPNLSAAFEIRSIPTLMVLRDGVLLFAQPGALPGAALDEIIGKVKALDMDDVRRQIAAAEAAEKNGEVAPGEESAAEPTKG
jgi:thioredoxin 1